MIPKLLSEKFFVFVFLISLLISFAMYSSSLNYYFFQDDFFEINLSRASDIKSYLDFFKFRDDIIAYRPISLQNYFFISQSLFGLNPVGFRLITFIFFLCSAFLVSKVINKITKNSHVGLLTAVFWVTASIHFMSLSWIAAAYNIIGTFFWLLTAQLFLNYLEKKKVFSYILSIVAFLLTIGSFEFSITWPIIFGFYYFYLLKNNLIKTLKLFSPFLLISLIYLSLRLFLIKVPQIPEYNLALNPESFKALFWYILWSFNVPEEFKKQVVNNLIVIRKQFLIDYWLLTLVSFISALWVITLGALVPIYRNFKQSININWRLLLFCTVFFTTGISPVLLLANHTFAMYLTLSSIGIYMFLSYLLVTNKNFLVTLSVVIIFLISSQVTLHFYRTNSWMVEAQKFSKNFATGIKDTYPYLPSNSIILYPLSGNQSRQALQFSNALQVAYDDASLTIYYNKSDLIKDLEKEIGNRPIYTYPQE